MRVASKVGNLPSKFGHARPLHSEIIRYVRDGQTDGRTDGQKQRLLHNNDSHKIETAHIAIVINSVTQYYTD